MTLDVPRVSVVIPAVNEAASVGQVVADVRLALTQASLGAFEILVIDDGSTDDTAELAHRAGARVIRSSGKRGYGAALKRGLRAVAADVVVVLDADGTYPAEEVPHLVRAVVDGADHAVGARTAVGAAVPVVRRPAKWVVRRLAEVLTGSAIPDLNSGLRCFRLSRVRRYIPFLPDGFSFTTSITVAALLDRQDVCWRSVDYRERLGRSKFRALRDTANLLLALMRAVAYYRPFRVFGVLAAISALASIATGAWDVLVDRNLGDKTVLLSLGALQLFALGLLADLVVKKVNPDGL